MKTITVELPINEVVDIVRLLRAESRCLIENGDVLPDIDVIKRAQNVLSARERIVTALEEFANLEDEPVPLPEQAYDLTQPFRIKSPAIDRALTDATALPEDREDDGLTVVERHHGLPMVEGELISDGDWEERDYVRWDTRGRVQDVLRRNAG